ncbi:MAG: ATP-dependent DNA helicase RecG, partial [Dehalococcoidia bacterium]|nr:ATP-dependent DNA helicase RecG [Dehalococcoidia bacterium]
GESPAGPIPSGREKEDSSPPLKGPPLKPTPIPRGVSLDSPVDRLRGVDAKLSGKLLKLDVATIRDLLYLLPRRHNDFSNFASISELVVGEEQTIVATVWEAREKTLGQKGRLKATEAVVSDETGNIRVVWIGQPYVARVLKPNSRVALSGKVEAYRGQLQFQSPEFEILDKQESLIHTGRLVPVYPGTEGLTPRRLRSIIWQALEQWVPRMEDFIPEDLRKRAKLAPLPEAILQGHYPDDLISLERARKRLAFDEFFLIQMAVLKRRRSWRDAAEGISVQANPKVRDGFIASLPFSLTDAQERCLWEILADMARGTPSMNRLLQGEVGSGKTVVALAGLLEAVASGYQGSIMVPTEVLAEQHFATVSRLLGGLARPLREENLITVYLDSLPRPISVGLLTGSTRAALKRELQQRVSEGTLDIAIGTHALIQEGVEFPRLALAVVDEQHRFGVMQRAALRQRSGTTPHLLVMSATPIPRTLALTIYGDLDVSTIDQLPPGRQQVLTRNVPPERRDAAYGFVRKEVRNGRQAFVICPLIEESDAVEARAATEEYERLSTEVFPDLRLGLLHGRMTPGEKEEVMGRFRNGDTDILVSTAVVEVGIDIPNATVMVVEGAHRFGLSQLHQFRGRVGRGENKSYCLLLSDYSTPEAKERLSAVERIHDGFQLAEVDLSLRGPGDYFGTRQSGLPALRVARLSDHDLLKSAREEAAMLLQDDPDLRKPHHESLAREVARFLDRVRAEVS